MESEAYQSGSFRKEADEPILSFDGELQAMVGWIERTEQWVMRSRLRWVFAGISALLIGYLLYRRSEANRRVEEQRRYLDREEKLRALAAAMRDDGEGHQTPPHEEQSNLPTN